MIQFTIMILLFMLISIMMMLINLLISKKMIMDREKSSPFECGFDPMSNNHMPFSIHFFMISLIFLVFDIEITLLIPLIFLTKNYNYNIIIYSLTFFFMLIYGLYIEYMEYSIDWKL